MNSMLSDFSLLRLRFPRLAAVILCVLLVRSPHVEAQRLDDVSMSGTVEMGDRAARYSLHITYAPSSSRGHPDLDRVIKEIHLTIDGHEIAFPKQAFEDLYSVGPPSGVYPDGTDPACGRFILSGGGGEKAYEVGFTFSRTHLVERDYHYTRIDCALVDPAPTRFADGAP